MRIGRHGPQTSSWTARLGEPWTARFGEPWTARFGEPWTARLGEPGMPLHAIWKRLGLGTTRTEGRAWDLGWPAYTDAVVRAGDSAKS